MAQPSLAKTSALPASNDGFIWPDELPENTILDGQIHLFSPVTPLAPGSIFTTLCQSQADATAAFVYKQPSSPRGSKFEESTESGQMKSDRSAQYIVRQSQHCQKGPSIISSRKCRATGSGTGQMRMLGGKVGACGRHHDMANEAQAQDRQNECSTALCCRDAAGL